MKKKIQRAVVLFLCLVMVMGVLPAFEANAAGGVAINSTSFPDETFRNYVSSFDNNPKDGTLSSSEIAAVTKIDVWNKGIADLKGIEVFTALVNLTCDWNELTSLDLSSNTKLVEVVANGNKLKTLTLGSNTNLKTLECYENKLTALDVSKCTALQTLYCSENQLKAIDVSRNTALLRLYCDINKFTTLDISNNPGLHKACLKSGYLESGHIRYSNNDDGVFRFLTFDPTVTLTGAPVLAPCIVTPPKSQTVYEGKNATFTVEAIGTNLSYQWYKNSNKIPGATKSTLTVTAKASLDGANYQCEVKNSADKTISSLARLKVIAKPKITTQPKAASVAAGKAVTFKVKATGASLKYQWFVMKAGTTRWAKLSGKTAATLKLTAKKNMNGYKYRCQVKNKAGSVYSKAVKLTVK